MACHRHLNMKLGSHIPMKYIIINTTSRKPVRNVVLLDLPSTCRHTGMQGVRSKELESRCRLLAERLTECALIADHDPSLALFRLQEHMSRSLPVLVKAKILVNASMQRAHHVQRDLDNAMVVTSGIERASTTLQSSCNLLKTCTRLRQDISQPTPPDSAHARSKSFHARRPPTN